MNDVAALLSEEYREQYASVNKHNSNRAKVDCGVPHGPLLFLIYMNDQHRICKHVLPPLFVVGLNEELSFISTWFQIFSQYKKKNLILYHVTKMKFYTKEKGRIFIHNIQKKVRFLA